MSEEIIKIEDYEQYWQKGGTYVMPVEVFYDLFYDIEQLQQENKDLKNKQNKFEKDYKEMIEIQGQNGNYNYDSYMLGLYNGMEYIISLYENREPIYRSGKDVNFLHENNILTEFEKWLKKGIDQDIYLNNEMLFHEFCVIAIDKLQELKEGNKNGSN